MVNKDFVEMVALLLLSTTAAGRWGGVDGPLYVICRAVRSRRAARNSALAKRA